MCRKLSWKNMICGWTFDVNMGGLDEPKQAFRMIIAAKHEFPGDCEKLRKLMPTDTPKTIQIDNFWGHRVGFLGFWSVLLKS